MVYWYPVPFQEGGEILPVYPVMTIRQPERGQVPFLNPPQYGYVTDPAASGDKTGGNIFWTPLFKSLFQVSLPVMCPL